MLRILHFSDNHGYRLELPNPDLYDIIISSGDFCANKTRGMLPFEAEWQTRWLLGNKKELADWLGPKPVFICSGNHDFVEPAEVLSDLGWTCISDRTIQYGAYKIFGYSYTPCFTGEWHHELSPDAEDAAVSLYLPEIEACDIFVSHGPLRGVLDRNRHGTRCGSSILKLALAGAKRLPEVMLCGHIHDQGGTKTGWVNANGKSMRIYNSATTYQILYL